MQITTAARLLRSIATQVASVAVSVPKIARRMQSPLQTILQKLIMKNVSVADFAPQNARQRLLLNFNNIT